MPHLSLFAKFKMRLPYPFEQLLFYFQTEHWKQSVHHFHSVYRIVSVLKK
jgi:hypothetical protein